MKKISVISVLCIIVLFLGCSKESKKLEVTPQSISVYSEGTVQLKTNVNDAKYSSNDTYYASVSQTGLVKGEKVGKTNIVVSSSSGSVTVPITIMNKYSLYPDLDGLIGKGMSDVTKILGSNYNTSTSSSGSVTNTYITPTNYADAIICLMSGSTVSSIGVLVPTTNTTMLTNHLLERYSIAGMQNEFYFFVNHGKKVVIALEVYSAKYLLVLYYEYTSTKASNQIDFSSISELNSIL